MKKEYRLIKQPDNGFDVLVYTDKSNFEKRESFKTLEEAFAFIKKQESVSGYDIYTKGIEPVLFTKDTYVSCEKNGYSAAVALYYDGKRQTNGIMLYESYDPYMAQSAWITAKEIAWYAGKKYGVPVQINSSH